MVLNKTHKIPLILSNFIVIENYDIFMEAEKETGNRKIKLVEKPLKLIAIL